MRKILSDRKDHRNGIYRPKRVRYPSLRGVSIWTKYIGTYPSFDIIAMVAASGRSQVPEKHEVRQEEQQAMCQGCCCGEGSC